MSAHFNEYTPRRPLGELLVLHGLLLPPTPIARDCFPAQLGVKCRFALIVPDLPMEVPS